MKKLMMIGLLAAGLTACNTEKKETVETKDVETTTVETTTVGNKLAINKAESTVWYQGGKVVGNDNHNGYVPFSDGFFTVQDNKVVGGEFVLSIADMTNEDISDDGLKEKYLTHMKSDEFFNTDEYPTASFKILEVEHPADGNEDGHNVTGVLTIKNNAKNITFPAEISVEDGKVEFEAEFNIDRTEFDVNYGSPTKFTDVAKDKAIKNVIELKVDAQS